MRNTPYIAAAASAALLALGGCNNDPVQVNTIERETNAPAPLAQNVVLPSIADSKIYRCSYPSNAVYYVDFFSNNSVTVRAGNANATPVRLSGTSPTGPFTGPGFTLTGSGNQVTINGQTCRARG